MSQARPGRVSQARPERVSGMRVSGARVWGASPGRLAEQSVLLSRGPHGAAVAWGGHALLSLWGQSGREKPAGPAPPRTGGSSPRAKRRDSGAPFLLLRRAEPF